MLRNGGSINRGGVIGRLHDLLENLEEERSIAKIVARRACEIYDWNVWVDPWLDVFHTVERKIPSMAERNPSLLRILDMLRRNGATPKHLILRELGWTPKQRKLSWTAFRKRLRQIAPDDSRRAEAIFELHAGQGTTVCKETLDSMEETE
jgi:hypothetical protein